jgi:hypothetical protein
VTLAAAVAGRAARAGAGPAPGRWLFSPALDLAAFAGSTALAFAFLAVGQWVGAIGPAAGDAGASGDVAAANEWAWICGVLLVDVAHVWSTAFVVYVDRAELARRPRLYVGTPIVAWVLGVVAYTAGELVFWRILAYLAVFHFVRQQYGWVMLYRARAGESREARLGRFVDAAAIYAATLYPLVVWHARLPRRFAWFVEGDFWALPPGLAAWGTGAERALFPVYVVALAAYAARALVGHARPRRGFAGSVGKHLVVATTAITWYVGIVVFDSDYAFTVLNVFAHGIPYLVLVVWYAVQRGTAGAPGLRPLVARGPLALAALVVGAVWGIAYLEELVWDRAIWHERTWLFGEGWDVGLAARRLLVPLLAVPQITHYVLDGALWRRTNPHVRASFAAAPASALPS